MALPAAEGGPALLVFTAPGAVFRATHTGPDGSFETVLPEGPDGCVRDAVRTVPGEFVTVGRNGRMEAWSLEGGRLLHRRLHHETIGMGRIAAAGGDRILYAALDDGRILRVDRREPAAPPRIEVMHRGAQGPRGIAAGRFLADSGREAVAIFGYSGRVELLAKTEDGWTVETLFQDPDKGHWLAAAELDGRNGTDEILLSGHGGRIVMLARPPCYGAGEERAR